MSGAVITDNSPVWYPTLEGIQLANWCAAAAVALICYDTVLMFPREVEHIWRKRWSYMSTCYVIVRYLGIGLALNFWAFNASIPMSPAVSVAVDRFANIGAFVSTVVGDIIMAMRIYAMYLGSKIILGILIVTVLTRITVGLAGIIVIFGPQSGIFANEWILSGIYVCGPGANTTSPLSLAWDILAIIINSFLFLLAAGRFLKHSLDTRRMMERWKASDLMSVLARDSIVYFFLNLLATILLMISVWDIPNNATYFSVISAYTQNELTVLMPRLVISFREDFDEDGQPTEHDGGVGTIGSVFKARTRTVVDDDEFELKTVDQSQLTSLQTAASSKHASSSSA